MLRRVMASVVLIALAILLLPCATSAQAKLAVGHECCAPSASVASQDCCNTANPKPATTSTNNGQILEADATDSVYYSQPVAGTASTIGIALQHQPALRPPRTILRT